MSSKNLDRNDCLNSHAEEIEQLLASVMDRHGCESAEAAEALACAVLVRGGARRCRVAQRWIADALEELASVEEELLEREAIEDLALREID